MTRARLAIVAAAALFVVGGGSACSAPWVPSWLRDAKGPIVPDWTYADMAGRSSENQHAMILGANPRDAGCPVVEIGVCIGEPMDGSPDETGVWHYHAKAGPCDAGTTEASP